MNVGKKNNKGFTLVELIVVIAILAVLAGVAIPAYTGYVKKANRAADDTLIATINRTAAAAVLEANGEDMANLEDKELTSNAVKDGNAPIYVERKNATKDAAQMAEVKTVFEKYFAGNETARLKWYGSLNFENGKFVGVESIMKAGLVVPDGNTVQTTFNNSSYSALGVSGMTEMVDTLAGALSEYGGLSSLTETAAFEATLRKLGIDPETADAQTKANASVFYLADYIDQIGNKEYTVDGVTKTGQEMLWETLDEGTLYTWLVNEAGVGLSGDDATFFNTALQYAAATAYAYSGQAPGDAADIIRNANPENNTQALGIVQQITEEEYFWDAYKSGKGAEDFYAFFEVMEVVNASNGSFNSFEGSGYFSNGELQAAINGILGLN